MPAVKPQSQTAPKPTRRKVAGATSSDSKQSTKVARKTAVKVTKPKATAPKADAGQKSATINLTVVTKETPGAYQMTPSAATLKGEGAKAPFVRQAYIRKTLLAEFESQRTVDLTFADGEQRGNAVMLKEQDRKSGKTVKAKAMQALYLVGADRLGIDAGSTVKVRLSLLPKDGGVKLIINPA